MPLQAGTRLGHFEVIAAIGAGGMGEVYRARDTRLSRDVALKILPDAFSSDPDRRLRFEREAQLLAALNHPHIAQIYGFEESSNTWALAMELVEGPTLADRLSHGPLPVEEAISLAKQICDALEYAHEHGVVHRDLKPANIKLTKEGTVKVLDFGLAKALDETPVAASVSHSPTLSLGATRQGVILGTAAYMSPEQARGQHVDRRADIWAFGCVLFEMFWGRQAFTGGTVSDILAAVLRAEVDLASFPVAVPPSVVRLIKRCLAKDPRHRLQHIGDARLELDTFEPEEQIRTAVQHAASWPHRVWFVVGVAAIGVAFATGSMVTRRSDIAPRTSTRFAFAVPAATNFNGGGGTQIAISPNGRLIAFHVERPIGTIYIRSLDGFDAEPLRGVNGGTYQFFSPDSAWLVFASDDGKLKKIPVSGGPAATICVLTDRPGQSIDATWLDDGSIVVSVAGVLQRVSSEGGSLQPLQVGYQNLYEPVAIPGSKMILARQFNLPNPATIVAVSLTSGEVYPLIPGLSPKLTASGDLLFVDGGTLWRVGLDRDALAVRGTPVPVAEGIRVVNQHALFDVSNNGALAYVPGAANAQGALVWLDRKGSVSQAVEERAGYASPRLSPEGGRIAVPISTGRGTNIWVIDLERGTRLPLTTSGRTSRPFWSPDGASVAYQNESDIYSVEATGGSPKLLLSAPGTQFPDTWTPDGKSVVYSEGGPVGERDLWQFRLGEAPQKLLATPYGERGASLSPDGKWMAFVSTDAGRDDIYVQAFPGPAAKTPISPAGGWQPLWSRDGKELFFRQDDWLMAAPVQLDPFRVGAPKQLFPFERRIYGTNPNQVEYDVAPSGRFLAVRRDSETQEEIRVILNWEEDLRSRP